MTGPEKKQTNSLYDDVNAMLGVSNFIYGLAALNRDRERVDRSNMNEPDFLKGLPKTAAEVLGWFKTNYALLYTSRKRMEFDFDGVQDILDRDEKDQISGEATLEVFDDEFAFKGRQAELVYGITRNPDMKRLTVAFRGSIDKKDWYQNFKVGGKEVELTPERFRFAIPNPNNKIFAGFDKVKIHSGFYEYIFELQQKTDKTTKFEEIVDEVTTRLKDPRNEGYSIYVTGHSLGGAVATLTGAALAISDDVPKPVRLVTFASPHVGKKEFAKAFQELEQDGRIQHLRVTNDDDITPQILGTLGYKHTGVHLNLYQKPWFDFFDRTTYSLGPSRLTGFWLWTNDMSLSWSWLWGVSRNHALSQHRKRLDESESDLNKMTFGEIFKNPKFKG